MDERNLTTAGIASADGDGREAPDTAPVDEQREATDRSPMEARPPEMPSDGPEDKEPPIAARPDRGPTNTAPVTPAEAEEGLIPTDEGQEYHRRWEEIQGRFVDQPRGSVEQADRLVATVISQLADTFARERSALERHWDRGDEVSTEDLRVALQRYRSFFDRLLAA